MPSAASFWPVESCSSRAMRRRSSSAERLSHKDSRRKHTLAIPARVPDAARALGGGPIDAYQQTLAGALLVFEKACRDWLDDHDLSLANRLFAALGGIPETEAGLALWRLAALAHADRETEHAVNSGDDWPAIRARLGQSEQGRVFRRSQSKSF